LKDALRAIALEQRGARERGELAGGAAAREIHLEEARLGVQEPLRTKRVLERLRADPCDADAVELDADPRLEPRYDGFPASPRQRRCEHGDHGRGRDDEQNDESGERPKKSLHRFTSWAPRSIL